MGREGTLLNSNDNEEVSTAAKQGEGVNDGLKGRGKQSERGVWEVGMITSEVK